MKKQKAKNPSDSDGDETPEEPMKRMREILQRASRATEKQTSLVNPHNKRATMRELYLSNFFRGSCGETMNTQSVGEYFIKLLRDSSAEKCEESFDRLIRMKKASENLTHRNLYALEAYEKYSNEFNECPSKAKLKKYMISRKDEFKDQPVEEDGKGWTRLWKSSTILDKMKLR
jgi:hypothetical protein